MELVNGRIVCDAEVTQPVNHILLRLYMQKVHRPESSG
jgi:hypothetical protein